MDLDDIDTCIITKELIFGFQIFGLKRSLLSLLKGRRSHLVIFGSKDLPYPTCYRGGVEFLLCPVGSSSTVPTCLAPWT